MNFSILITNYKAWPVTLETVLAVLEFGGDQLSEVLIVDDCSDAPSEWSGDNRVRIHRNSNNQGYVRSVNIGVSLLKEELIVMFDCDARPLSPFAETIQEAFTNDVQLGVLGFTQTDDSGVLRPSGEPGPSALEFVIGPAFWSRLPRPLRDFLSPPASYLCIHSCCFAFRKRAFDQIKGFDESFDFLDADMDFSISLNRAGWKSAISDKVICFHPGGGSPQSTTTRVLRLHRNRWQLLRKHGLVKHKAFAKIGLILRHSFELLSLYSIGVCQPSKRHNLREKIECRKQLLKTAKNNYLS
jgi:GT2 family glycosyltransferase